MRILQVVDDALAAALSARTRAEGETRSVKEADAAPRSDLAKGLHALAREVSASDVSITYSDLAEVLS